MAGRGSGGIVHICDRWWCDTHFWTFALFCGIRLRHLPSRHTNFTCSQPRVNMNIRPNKKKMTRLPLNRATIAGNNRILLNVALLIGGYIRFSEDNEEGVSDSSATLVNLSIVACCTAKPQTYGPLYLNGWKTRSLDAYFKDFHIIILISWVRAKHS